MTVEPIDQDVVRTYGVLLNPVIGTNFTPALVPLKRARLEKTCLSYSATLEVVHTDGVTNSRCGME